MISIQKLVNIIRIELSVFAHSSTTHYASSFEPCHTNRNTQFAVFVRVYANAFICFIWSMWLRGRKRATASGSCRWNWKRDFLIHFVDCVMRIYIKHTLVFNSFRFHTTTTTTIRSIIHSFDTEYHCAVRSLCVSHVQYQRTRLFPDSPKIGNTAFIPRIHSILSMHDSWIGFIRTNIQNLFLLYQIRWFPFYFRVPAKTERRPKRNRPCFTHFTVEVMMVMLTANKM